MYQVGVITLKRMNVTYFICCLAICCLHISPGLAVSTTPDEETEAASTPDPSGGSSSSKGASAASGAGSKMKGFFSQNGAALAAGLGAGMLSTFVENKFFNKNQQQPQDPWRGGGQGGAWNDQGGHDDRYGDQGYNRNDGTYQESVNGAGYGSGGYQNYGSGGFQQYNGQDFRDQRARGPDSPAFRGQEFRLREFRRIKVV